MNNTQKVIEKALNDKRATANNSTNEDSTENVLGPSSPLSPNGPQPVSELQQAMNMMNERTQQMMDMLTEQKSGKCELD